MSENRPKILIVDIMFLLKEQMERLEQLGEVEEIFKTKNDIAPESYFQKCLEADVICAYKTFIDYKRLYELHDVLISIPFGKPDFWNRLDIDRLNERNITIKHTRRRYKEALVEWIIYMMLTLSRGIKEKIRTEEDDIFKNLATGYSLAGKNVTILGKGVIGTALKPVCDSLKMNVNYYTRDSDLLECVKDADFVVNCLGVDAKSGFLDKNFFNALKKGSYFIYVASPRIYDHNALFEALDDGTLMGAADDVASAKIGDTGGQMYKKLLENPKVLITPHIAWRTDFESEKSYDPMIDEIELYLDEKNF